MPILEKKNFVFVTKMSGGWITCDPGLDPGFKKELDAYKDGTLKEKHPDRSDINHSPYNFHDNTQWLEGPDYLIKDSVKISRLTVPKENEDGSPNVDGVIILEDENDVVLLWNSLLSMGRTNMYLNTQFGKDISPEAKKRLKNYKPAETDSIMKPVKRK